MATCVSTEFTGPQHVGGRVTHSTLELHGSRRGWYSDWLLCVEFDVHPAPEAYRKLAAVLEGFADRARGIAEEVEDALDDRARDLAMEHRCAPFLRDAVLPEVRVNLGGPMAEVPHGR